MNPRLLALVLIPLLALGANAQQQIEILSPEPDSAPEDQPAYRPEAARRVVRAFDFEEQQTNPLPVPQDWLRAQDHPQVRARPGFPIYNEAELDYTSGRSGEGSVRLPSRGGSTSLLLQPGAIPALPNTDYLISGWVRTDGARHARGLIAARFLDAANTPIPASEVRTELVLSPDAWTEVSTPLWGDHPDAAFLQVELLLLQPEHYLPPARRHDLRRQDFSAVVWFDDVAIVQLPRVELSTGAPANVIALPDTPTLEAVVRDLTGDDLDGRITVRDVNGRVVAQAGRTIGAGRARWIWTPELPALGWYLASLELRTGETVVGSAHTSFVWLPAPARPTPRRPDDVVAEDFDRRRFMLNLGTIPSELIAQLPAALSGASLGGITIPVWNPQTMRLDLASRLGSLIPPIARLQDDGREVSLAIPRVPAFLALPADVDPADPAALLAADPEHWAPDLDPFLDRLGQSVARWQLGVPGDDRAFDARDLPALVDAAEQALARFVPGPVLVLCTTAELPLDSFPGPAPGGVVTLWPNSLPPSSIEILADAASAGTPDLERTVAIEPLDPESFGYPASVADLVKRVVYAWGAFPEASGPRAPRWRLALVDPWAWSGHRRPQMLPRPELAVWRTLTDRLVGRRVVGEYEASPGVRCFILAPAPDAGPDRDGALVAWREDAAPRDAFIRAFLGPDPVRVVDPFGNISTVAAAPIDGSSSSASRPVHTIPVTETPVFIEGVDVGLVRFLASLRLDPPMISAAGGVHEHAIVFENTWPVAATGRIYVVEPGGLSDPDKPRDRSWNITPRSIPFSVPPGQAARLPLTIAFSPSELAGPKTFVIDVELAAEHDAGILRAAFQAELGLAQFRLDLSERAVEGDDVFVEAIVTNTGDSPVTLELWASAPDQPRARATITDLPPGVSITRRFPFKGGRRLLQGQDVFVGVVDAESGTRLNKAITIR